jgi:two-component system, OmpR family, sensor histidine kinase KdpD
VRYLLAVMVSASRFGRGPALLPALLSVLAYDFFLLAPALTLSVQDGRCPTKTASR